MTLPQLISWMLAALAGAIAHELAHWIVWVVLGRKPELDLWNLEVRPTAGPPYTTLGDRVAAAAPYVVGVCALYYGLTTGAIIWAIFGVSIIQIPSRADVMTMRGRVTWRSLAG